MNRRELLKAMTSAMCDYDSVIWPSTLPPCPVSLSWRVALQIAMAQQMDEMWKQDSVYGFPAREIDYKTAKPTHRKDGPPPTAMSFEPSADGK